MGKRGTPRSYPPIPGLDQPSGVFSDLLAKDLAEVQGDPSLKVRWHMVMKVREVFYLPLLGHLVADTHHIARSMCSVNSAVWSGQAEEKVGLFILN